MSTIQISNHLDHGRGHQDPDRIVVHAMGEFINNKGVMYTAAEWLDYLGYSAHILVTPAGDLIRCRHDDEGAWHARGYNRNSLGIEFLVEGQHDYGTFLEAIKTDWVTDMQYVVGKEVIENWLHHHDILHIDRHSDLSPGRKVDPGTGFKWDEFLASIST